MPGALVAINYGAVRQSYATGCICTFRGGGGLVGANGATGVVEQSFATGFVGSAAPPGAPWGGIAGYNSGTIANNVYWNKETTLRASASENNTGTQPPNANGLTTAQMSNAVSFDPSWDFSATGTWALPAGVTHPVLSWQLAH